MENYARVFADIYGIDIAVFRYFNVFGPRQDPNSPYSAVIPKFIKTLFAGGVPTIHGDGSQSRDFTFVDNVVHANLLGARAKQRLSGVYNIACGDNTTVLQLTRGLMDIIGVAGEPAFSSPRPGDIRFSQANIEKARTVLGYEPQVSIREGLERTVAWYRENGID
jgi:nucleoside-diphosphate-sugar epimerase